MNRKKIIAVASGCVVVLVGVAIILMAPEGDPSPAGKPRNEVDRKSPMEFDFTGGRRERTLLDPRRALNDYKKYAVYPPTSRPITSRRLAALKYDRRVKQFLPVLSDSSVTGEKKPRFYSAFTADRFNVFANQTIHVTLQAVDAPGKRGKRIPVRFVNAFVLKGRHPDAPKLLDLKFRDDGKGGDAVAGDLIYTVAIKPAAVPTLANHHGALRVVAQYQADGLSSSPNLFFNYYPPKGIAARFTGKFREAVENGSLIVYAELNVLSGGHYALDASLLTSADKAVCHSRYKGVLKPGRNEVPFLFFGKVLRDADLPGSVSFKVVELYGEAVPSPKEMMKLAKSGPFHPRAVPLYDGHFATRSYDRQDFSSNEWKSQHKDKKIQNLKNLISNQRSP